MVLFASSMDIATLGSNREHLCDMLGDLGPISLLMLPNHFSELEIQAKPDSFLSLFLQMIGNIY